MPLITANEDVLDYKEKTFNDGKEVPLVISSSKKNSNSINQPSSFIGSSFEMQTESDRSGSSKPTQTEAGSIGFTAVNIESVDGNNECSETFDFDINVTHKRQFDSIGRTEKRLVLSTGLENDDNNNRLAIINPYPNNADS